MKPVTFTLQKYTDRSCSSSIIRKQAQLILNRSLPASMVSWDGRITVRASSEADGKFFHEFKITFKKNSGQKSIEERQLEEIKTRLIKACSHASFNKYPWTIVGLDKSKIKTTTPKVDKEYFNDLKMDAEGVFDHIYDRDHQIKILLSSISEAIDSGFSNRFHCLMHGPPGCAKTDIMRSCGKMLGEENEAYLMFDATSTTEAGVYQILNQAEHIPPILFVEEPEKADEKSLRWLLGMMDQRGEIRRTNCRTGNGRVKANMLVVAAVNDMALLKKIMSGALASRFSHELYCPPPSEAVLRKILEREVSKKNGKTEWIEPTLKFCAEVKLNDPRKVVPICLCGKDNLLDGSFQDSLRKVSFKDID